MSSQSSCQAILGGSNGISPVSMEKFCLASLVLLLSSLDGNILA
jgi:hypothetical protein